MNISMSHKKTQASVIGERKVSVTFKDGAHNMGHNPKSQVPVISHTQRTRFRIA